MVPNNVLLAGQNKRSANTLEVPLRILNYSHLGTQVMQAPCYLLEAATQVDRFVKLLMTTNRMG